MGDFTTVASLDDVPENRPTGVEVGDLRIVLIRTSGGVHALEDECSHEEFPLSEGEVLDGQIECALHGARFDLASGDAKALPAVQPVKTYECRIEDGEVQVRLE